MSVSARVKSEPVGSLHAYLNALEGSSPVASARGTLWKAPLRSHNSRSQQYPAFRSTVGVMSERLARTGAVDTKSGTAPDTAGDPAKRQCGQPLCNINR